VDIQGDWIAQLGPPRPLRFGQADPGRDLPAHVRAGSGLRRWGGRLVVVQDDVNALALVDERTGAVTPLLLPAGAGGRRHFSEGRGNKAAKMDLEACAALPDGRLLVVGSGSSPARERLVLVEPDLSLRVVEAGPLFAHLRSRPDFAGAELNLEGAVVVGGRLWLFQRGNGRATAGRAPCSAVGELALSALLDFIDRGAGPPSLAAVRRVELGQVGGVPFGFTDATALPDGRVVFLAGAEASPDATADGPVLGARVGLLEGEQVVLCEIVDEHGQPTPLKLEGIDLLGVDGDGALRFAVVADMDDPELPAALAALRWGPPAGRAASPGG
jgi:hypothetical protein